MHSHSHSPEVALFIRTMPDGGSGVFAARALAAGEVLGRFNGVETTERSRMSLQFGPDLHVEPAADEPLRFLNHACVPTAVFKGRVLYAARDLEVGAEITIDYTAHEDTISHPFVCRCGAPGCPGLIQGRGLPTSRDESAGAPPPRVLHCRQHPRRPAGPHGGSMRFLKSRTWSVAEIACLKWSSILFGALVGAYISDLVKTYVWLFVVSIIVLAIKPLTGYFRD